MRRFDVWLLVLVLGGVLYAQQKIHAGVGSDGALYFAHLRSVVFDHDLDIREEIAILKQEPRPHDVIPIGPAILWAPAYLGVAAVDKIGAAAGAWSRDSTAALGLQGAYVQAAVISSFLIMAVGLLTLHVRLRREFGPSPAFLASVLVLGATTLIWYVIYEPSMTHAASFGVVAILLVLTERWLIDRAPTVRTGLWLGAWFSLVLLVRPEDGIFLLFPLAALLFAPACRAVPLGERAKVCGAMALGAAPLLVLQALMLRSLLANNSFSLIGGNEGYLNVLNSEWVNVLFASRHGLFSWTPFAWVALIGTVAYAPRRPLWAIPALLAFVALVWINGSAHDWAGGWAFGGRRFTSIFPALAPGVAIVVAWIQRRPLAILVPAAAVIVGWNVLLMDQFAANMLPRDETVRFDTLVRQQADVLVRPPFAYPFAFPANALFAWREGLPIDKYDLLGPEPLRRQMYLPLNDWGERFLLDGGWQNGAGDASGSAHFMTTPSGTIVAPLDVPAGTAFGVDVEARAAGQPVGGRVPLDVSVNGRSLGAVDLEVNAGKPTRHTFIAPAGAKLWRRGYNRVTLSRPAAANSTSFIIYALRLGASADGRTLGTP